MRPATVIETVSEAVGTILTGQHFILLQGPLGPFFADMAHALMAAGATVERICFNRGDWHYSAGDHVTRYQGRAEAWEAWFLKKLRGQPVSAVLAYGDSRMYHRVAGAVCKQEGVRFFGLEEGYVRPGFVTFEEGGNNANSFFPAKFNQRYPDMPAQAAPTPAPQADVFLHQLWFAVHYYVMKDWRIGGFGHYAHHRRGNWLTETTAWVRAGVRKHLVTKRIDRQSEARLLAMGQEQPLFFVPLQVAVDAQMVYHSRFPSVAAFIEEVIRSFADHAPKNAQLVLKHHPMDRGFNHYGRVVQKYVRQFGLNGCVDYVFDLDIEQLLKVSAGCVTVNSTVGMQALETGVPTIMLGTAAANIAGLTDPAPLDQFWCHATAVDKAKVQAFRHALLCETQIPGSFYKVRDITATAITKALALKLAPKKQNSVV